MLLFVSGLLMLVGYAVGYEHGTCHTQRIERRRHDVLTRILRGI